MTEVAAGGLVWRSGDEGLQLLLVHRPAYDDWGFAKGKPNEGESLEETALREVAEESGMRCRLGQPLGGLEYVRGDGTDKVVHLWAMEPFSGEFVPNREVDRVRWAGLDQAIELLTYQGDRQFVEGLDTGWHDPCARIFLVRHAHAGVRGSGYEDRFRPLSPRGWDQSRGLVDLLAAEPVEALLTSPYTRCHQTLEPVGDARRLAITDLEELGEDDPEASLPVLIEASEGTVLCSHGNVFPIWLDHLEEVGCALERRPTEKGASWIVDLDDQGMPERARYVKPPA